MSKDDRNTLRLFFLLVVAGVILLWYATFVGRAWDPAELVYDAGKTLMFLALLDLFVVRIMRRLSEQRSRTEQLLVEIEQALTRAKKLQGEIDAELKNNQMTLVQTRVELIYRKVESLHQKLIDDPLNAALDAVLKETESPDQKAHQEQLSS